MEEYYDEKGGTYILAPDELADIEKAKQEAEGRRIGPARSRLPIRNAPGNACVAAAVAAVS